MARVKPNPSLPALRRRWHAALGRHVGGPGSRARLLLALVPPLVVFVVQQRFWDLFAPFAWFLFYPAVFLSAWVGGLYGGLSATLVAVALGWWFFVPPAQSFVKPDITHYISGAVFVTMGVLFSLVHGRVRTAYRQAADVFAAGRAVDDALRRSEERYRDLIERAPDGVFIADLEGRYTDVNGAGCRLLGYTREEIIGKTILDLIPPADAERLRRSKRRMRQGVADVDEWTLRRKDGSYVAVEVNAQILPDGRWQGFVRDLTKRRRMEQALHDSHENLNRAQAVARTGSWRLDTRRDELTWSDETYRIFGIPRGTRMTYEVFLAHVHPDDRERVRQAWDAALRGAPYDIEHRIVVGDLVKWVRERAELEFDENGSLLGGIGTVQDVTERRHIEEALRATAEQIRDLYNNAPCGYHSLDADGIFVQINDTELGWLGYQREEIIGKLRFAELLTPASRNAFVQNFARLKDAGFVRDLEYELVRKGGSVLPVLLSSSIVRDPDGKYRMSRSTVFDHTERRRVERALRDSEERVRLLLDSAGEGVFGVDMDGKCTFINPAGVRMLGYASAQDLLGTDIHALVHHSNRDGAPCPPDACRVLRAFREDRRFQVDDEVFWRRDGESFAVEYHSSPIVKDGRIAGAVATFNDITARRDAEEKLRQAAIVLQGTNEAIMVTDAAGRIVTVNRAFTDITGYEPHEVIGRDPRLLQSGRQGEDFYRQVWATLHQVGQWQGEIWDRRKNGEVFPAWENIGVVKDDNGRVLNYVALLSDISMIKQAEEKLRYLAHHDVLTDLPNRLLFSANLDQALEHARRQGKSLALMFLDLDRFKLINDTLGHAVGDRLLQQVAQRLRAAMRAEDIVSRLGGDEFTVIMGELDHPEDAALLAEKLIAAFRNPMVVDGSEMMVRMSIGISVFPENAHDSGGLTKAADAALYRAKERGRNTYEFYTPELTARALDHLAMEQALRGALERSEFELYYQPEVDLPTGKIVRVEALLRWRHPSRGLLEPETFMAVAEDSGLIEPIGEWVFRAACEQAATWRAAGLAGRIAINLSGRQVVRASLVERFATILRETGAPPDRVELEITESVLHRVEQSRAVLERLKGLGLRLAIDDFGAGYSSLAHLRHLPIDTLKIDRSFVEGVPANAESNSIVEAIITLGHGLRLTVVGEGIETPAQHDFLHALRCDYVQGNLYGRAAPLDETERLLARGVTGAGGWREGRAIWRH